MSLSDGPKRTGCDLPRLRSPQALGCGLWRLPKHQLWFLTFFFHPDRKSSIHLRACRPSLVCCLFLHGTQTKNDFMFFNSWKQVERRTFHDSRKLHENQTSVSISKVKLKYSHVIHLKFVYVCFLATIAELSSYEREREREREWWHTKPKIFSVWLLEKCLPTPDQRCHIISFQIFPIHLFTVHCGPYIISFSLLS